MIDAAERAGLEVIGLENFRADYAWTCAQWVKRLQARSDACLTTVDTVTYRTWLLYLAAAAASFERGDIGLHHVLLRRPDRHGEGRKTVRVAIPLVD